VKGNPALLAYLEQLQAYYEDPSVAPHNNPPRPPTQEMAIDLAAASAQILAIYFDYQATGEVHMQPSVQAQLTAAEYIAEHLP
jgi:hypothetical protein